MINHKKNDNNLHYRIKQKRFCDFSNVNIQQGIIGIKDLDRYLLYFISDDDLFNYCITNKYIFSLCCEEYFWMNKVINKWGKYILKDSNFTEIKKHIEENYLSGKSWLDYYFWIQKSLISVKEWVDDAKENDLFISLNFEILRKDLLYISLESISNFFYLYMTLNLNKFNTEKNTSDRIDIFFHILDILNTQSADKWVKETEGYSEWFWCTMKNKIKEFYLQKDKYPKLKELEKYNKILFNEEINIKI